MDKKEVKSILEVKNLCFSHYRAPLCLKDVAFSLSFNEKMFLFGRKEVGKSTLLKVVSNFETSYFGSVLLEGKNIKEYSETSANVSLLLNKPVFFENKSIESNIDYLCEVYGLQKMKKEEIETLLVDWKIRRSVDEKVKKLTLLEKRKLSIVRSVIKNPRVMFIEDLFDGFDGEDFKQMLEVYEKLLDLKISAIFEIENETYKNAKEFFEKLKYKTLFLSFARIEEYDSVLDCIQSLKNIDYFEYANKFSVVCDLIKEGERFYFEFKDDFRIEILSKVVNHFEMSDLNDVENVILYFNKKINVNNLTAEELVDLEKRKEFFVCSSIDGRRLI